MCGINALFGLEALSEPRVIVQRMNERIAHRGPDASGIELFSNAALGHRRLSVIDLSSAADQPMKSHCGRYTIAFNGEVYNFREIRRKLTDYQFKTDSDSEVILAAYKAWGPACLQEFNGMFAFALWDSEIDQMFLARDRVGIKPLYYSEHGGTYVFSSELRGILASGIVKPRLDRQMLNEYLAYQTVHDPNTILKGVKALPAGHYMILSDTDCQIKKYWSASASRIESDHLSKNEIHSLIKTGLYQSVERRLISDVPFGAFLSGGIDSSAMVGIMSEVSKSSISTFSVTFDDSEFSEAKYAKMVSEKFRTDHKEIKLTPDDFLQLLPESLSALDHPSGDGPNTYVVSKVTKAAGITVAISGLGGDELFAGYPHFLHYHSAISKQWISQYPMFIRRALSQIIGLMKPGIPGIKAGDILTSLRMNLPHVYPILREAILRKEREALLDNSGLENPLSRLLSEPSQEWAGLPILSQVTLAEINTYMRNVLLRDTDQMSMAHALEVRVPFLDHELVELLIGVRDEVKYPTNPKSLLIESLGGLIPDEVVNRPKMGFTLPWVHWMKNEMRSFCEEKLKTLAERDLFNRAELDMLWQRFLNDDPIITWSRVWPLIVLENWIEENDVQT